MLVVLDCKGGTRMTSDLVFWNNTFERVRRQERPVENGDSNWIATYIPLMRGQRVERILEIGCGSGSDTVILMESGFDVTATDYSVNALSIVRDQLTEIPLLLHDARDRFPFSDGSFDMIVAGLSLHYFDQETTIKVTEELKRLLRPRGLLLYRVNSVNDPECGTGQGDLLEPDYYLQNGVRRRYFSIDTCRTTFRGWEELLLEEKAIHRYDKTKVICEGLLRKTE